MALIKSSAWNPSIGGSTWSPSRTFLLEHLSVPEIKALELHKLPRGMDNARIDVLLSPELVRSVDDLIHILIRQHLKLLNIRETPIASLSDAITRFNELHAQITLTVAQQARASSERELAQLYQLSLVKLILTRIDQSLEDVRDELEPANDSGLMEGTVTQHHLSAYGLQQPEIRYAVCQELMRLLSKTETCDLRKLRKSVLGMSWPVAEAMLFSPLLPLGGMDSDASFLTVYPLLLRKRDNFLQMNRIVAEVFSEWLPDYVGFPPVALKEQDYKSLPTRRDKGDLPGYVFLEAYLRTVLPPAEYKDGERCWLDKPENLLALMGGDKQPWPQPGSWRHKSFDSFQKSLLNDLDKLVQQAGLGDELYASVLMPELCGKVKLYSALMPAYQYVCGKTTRRAMQQQLQNTRSIINGNKILQRLDEARKEVRSMASGKNQHLIAGVFYGFAKFRQDLKLSWEIYRNLDMIRLLDNEDDINLSRSNSLLHEFSSGRSTAIHDVPVSGHVIIKADLRGSTALTATMIAQELNPAAYFSQNLFEPITSLLDRYEAVKVFVEGDAVILMILEHEGHQQNSMVIARACGLAYHMIEVVKKRNRDNRHLGLPELELGIGIAYVEEAPNYLFDEGRKITISPAINRADRLSSCDAGLRAAKLGHEDSGWGVEVVLPADNGKHSQAGQKALKRYNVNGIELDLPAYTKLSRELVLRRIKGSSLGGSKRNRYHVGRFPDSMGRTEWLLVREAPVRAWNGKRLKSDNDIGMRFFEVVTNTKMIAAIRSKLTAKKEKAEPETSVATGK